MCETEGSPTPLILQRGSCFLEAGILLEVVYSEDPA